MKIRRIDFYPTDWLEGTAELNSAERGVYITICALIYARGGPITYELLKAASLSHGLSLNRCLQTLKNLGKIIENGERITQERCEKELRRRRETIEKAHINGAKGGRPNGLAKADGFGYQKPNNQQSTINNQQREESPNGDSIISLVHSLDSEFDEIWMLFLRRVGKGQARKAYRAARKHASFDKIIAGVRKHAIECQTIELKFIPHPATWLNGQRWLDEETKVHGQDLFGPYGRVLPERDRPPGPAPTPEELNEWLRQEAAKHC